MVYSLFTYVYAIVALKIHTFILVQMYYEINYKSFDFFTQNREHVELPFLGLEIDYITIVLRLDCYIQYKYYIFLLKYLCTLHSYILDGYSMSVQQNVEEQTMGCVIYDNQLI